MKHIFLFVLFTALTFSQQVYTNTGDTVGAATGIWYDSGTIKFNNNTLIDIDKGIHWGQSYPGLTFIDRDGSSSGNTFRFAHWGDIAFFIDNDNNDTGRRFIVYTNGADTDSATELFRINENGNIGIATSTPGGKLDIATSTWGSTALNFSGASTPTINFEEFGFKINCNARGSIIYYGWTSETSDFLELNNKASTLYPDRILLSESQGIIFDVDSVEVLRLTTTGEMLFSGENGIKAKKVKLSTSGWSDFVFNDDYNLMSLPATEQFIKTNRHLPDIPSESVVKLNGIEVGEMQARLLQKIEELTLHVIDLDKRDRRRAKEIKELKAENKLLKQQVDQ